MTTADQAHTTLGLLRSTAMRGRRLLPAPAPRSAGLLRPQPAPQLGPVTLAIAARGNLAESDPADDSLAWEAAGAELALGLRALLEEAGAA